MRKIIGVGESILDILFENNQPVKAVPGGSVFNGMVSLSRMRVPTCFISEVGKDKVGEIILDFMRENGMETKHVSVFPDGVTAISLAFLNDLADAEYVFYRNYPAQRLDNILPFINPEDIFVFGSYYALNPVLREQILELLNNAQERKAIIYYDPNFRKSHVHESLKLQATLIENLEFADIVRGSDEDFHNMYELNDPDEIYRDKIRFFTDVFIYTQGKNGISLRTPTVSKEYNVPLIDAKSTVGAGDNFNAGILYGLMANNIKREELKDLTETVWDKIIASGIAFSTEVCKSLENYVSLDFAAENSIF